MQMHAKSALLGAACPIIVGAAASSSPRCQRQLGGRPHRSRHDPGIVPLDKRPSGNQETTIGPFTLMMVTIVRIVMQRSAVVGTTMKRTACRATRTVVMPTGMRMMQAATHRQMGQQQGDRRV